MLVGYFYNERLTGTSTLLLLLCWLSQPSLLLPVDNSCASDTPSQWTQTAGKYGTIKLVSGHTRPVIFSPFRAAGRRAPHSPNT